MGRQTARKRILNIGMLLLVATILVFVFRRDYRAILESMRGISFVIIGALVLLCTWKRVRQLLAWLIGKLPDHGAWVWRKEEWTRNLEMLYQESAALLRDRYRCGQVFFLNFLKLSWLYMIPFISLRILGVKVLEVSQAVALSAVMLLITGALPNVAGIGPLEFAFLLLFGAAAGRVEASSALILYRVATYFFPFLLSIGVFFQVKKDWEAKSG